MVRHLNTIASLLLASLLWIAAGAIASAQVDTTRDVAPDTIVPPVRAESTTTESGYLMTKSPLAATLYSIVPGGGQLYNEQYIKSALFVGAAGYFAVQAFRYHVQFTDKAREVDTFALDDPARDFPKREREFYRDNRDLNIAYFIGVQILSMIDAYVGAHLYDFDVDNSEDGLSSRLYLDPERMGVGLMMRW